MLQIISLVCVGLNAYAYAYRWEAWRSESEEVFFSYEYIYIYGPLRASAGALFNRIAFNLVAGGRVSFSEII